VTFPEKLRIAWRERDSMACLGLDPDLSRMPSGLSSQPGRAILEFNKHILDATADLLCAVKPQWAFYGALGTEGLDALAATLAYCRERFPALPIILDFKRGDVGNTAEQYAVEGFDLYGADAVTVNPYLGKDATDPFLKRADRGVILLCKTSNRGSGDFQNVRDSEGTPLFLRVARTVALEWNANGNCGLVVGATFPEELARVRALVGDMPILVPGIGAQGGDLEASLRAGRDSTGYGLMVSSSRGILYASRDADYPQAARQAAQDLRDAMRACA
jgi:orotidine-5'-phosphate decarboxylase